MSDIIKPDFRLSRRGYPVIRKEVEGKIIEVVDIDALTVAQRIAWERDQAKLGEETESQPVPPAP